MVIQKEKVDIDGEKGAQTIMTTNKIVTQELPYIMIIDSRRVIACICFRYYVHITVCYWLLIVLILLKMEFGHAQISMPKSGISMSKRAYDNPLRH